MMSTLATLLAAMASVQEILSRRPPEILYHYTSQEGLLGIICKKEMWASHTQYLNDQREFRHAIELVRDELSRMVRQANTQTRPFVEEMNQGIEPLRVLRRLDYLRELGSSREDRADIHPKFENRPSECGHCTGLSGRVGPPWIVFRRREVWILVQIGLSER